MLRCGRLSVSRVILTSRGPMSSVSSLNRGIVAVRRHAALLCVGSAAAFSLGGTQSCSLARCDVAVVKEKKERSSSSKQRRRSRRMMRRLRRKIVAWIEMFLRAIYLSLVFAPAAITLPIALVSGIDQEDVNDKTRGAWWWPLLRNCIKNSGPCTIKFSQWIATRPDLFPLALCRQLQDLQVNASRHPISESLETLRSVREVKGLLESKALVLDENDRGELVVLGSGCIAQVFCGNLTPLSRDEDVGGSGDSANPNSNRSGKPQRVAVKVVHPHAAKSISSDTNIMLGLTRAIELLPGVDSLSLHESVKEFTALMQSQLDLRAEADALHKFRKNFALDRDTDTGKGKGSSNSYTDEQSVRFPEPLISAKSVLIESLEDGSTVADAMPVIEGDTEARSRLAKVLLDSILKMTFEDNYIHADLHSGNIIVRGLHTQGQGQGQCQGQGQGQGQGKFGISMIDAGLVARLSGQDRRNFIDLFSAVVRNRGTEAGNLMIERNRHPANAHMSPAEREDFAAEIAGVVSEVHASGLSLGRIGVAALLQKVLVACYKHHVKLESKFVSTVLAIGVVEGLGRRLDPDVDVLKRAAPYVLRATLQSH